MADELFAAPAAAVAQAEPARADAPPAAAAPADPAAADAPPAPADGELVDHYRRMAAGGRQFHGHSIRHHSRTIAKLVHRFGAVTLLDYGSGRGDAYTGPLPLHEAWGVPVPRLYDPAFPQHAERPDWRTERFDGVLCSDVLEHLPEGEALEVISWLFLYARLFVWASVCCRPAKKTLPDGRNLHVTVRPFEWWLRQFGDAGAKHGGLPWCLTETL